MSGYIAYVFCTVLLAVSTFSQPARRFFRIRLLFLFHRHHHRLLFSFSHHRNARTHNDSTNFWFHFFFKRG